MIVKLSRRYFSEIKMKTIPFELLKRLLDELTALQRDILDEWNLEKATAVCENVLTTLFEERPFGKIMGTYSTKLSLFSMIVQLLCMGLVLYAQGHTGRLTPPFLAGPLIEIEMEKLPWVGKVVVHRQSLACMGDMIGDDVFVFGSRDFLPTGEGNKHYLEATCEQIVDTWGPGYLIAAADVPDRIYGLGIRGGIISPHRIEENVFHWQTESGHLALNDKTFGYREVIKIGGININGPCPLDTDKSRKMSVPYLSYLGTRPDWWDLTEKQAVVQGGNYVIFQVGATYSKLHGATLKEVLLDRWNRNADFSVFEEPWGLQVSLCTGVSRRVPLRALIDKHLVQYIDCSGIKGWSAIRKEAISTIEGSARLGSWIETLQDHEKECMKKVLTRLLNLLRDTGFDRGGKLFSILWPYNSDARFCVKIRPDDNQIWCNMLKESEWCATFAVLTSLCLEGPQHKCRNITCGQWSGGKLLSTVVCQNLSGTTSIPSDLGASGITWQLKHNEKYWVGKPGGNIWVIVHKHGDAITELRVKNNSFPGRITTMLLKEGWNGTLRERPDVSFEGEDVFVCHK